MTTRKRKSPQTESRPRKALTLRRETLKDLGTGTRGRAVRGGASASGYKGRLNNTSGATTNGTA